MKMEVLFDIPDPIAGKLATGTLERVGGVVRDPNTGQVVMWLRETSPSPTKFPKLPSKGSNLLGMAGHGASILNLGATIAFGTATLMKLSKIEKKLDAIDAKLDVMNTKLDELLQRAQNLQWTIELGFANTLSALANISHHQEVELIGELNSAATLAWSCQFLEPGSQQRINRIENALHTASNTKEKLVLHARQEMQAACEEIQKKRKSSYYGFAFDDSPLKALSRLRQAITASSLCASICAEADSLYAASSILAKEHQIFSSLLLDTAKASLDSNQAVYATLLSPDYSEFMPAARIDSWAKKYDGKTEGLLDVLDMSRQSNILTRDDSSLDSLSSTTHPSTARTATILMGAGIALGASAFFGSLNSTESKQIKNEQELNPEQKQLDQALKSTIAFIDMIDGSYLDLDRLRGYQAEYKAGSDMNMSIHEYREVLQLNEIEEANSICFLSTKETA